MKCLPLATLAMLAATTGAAGIADEFVQIPANPSFAFAKSLNPHSSDAGEASPIMAPYRLYRHPVTNAEYAEFTTATGQKTPGYWGDRACPQGRERHPVLAVSYSDVLAFCEWKSALMPGWRFRPPTEAEWENAATGAKVGNYNAVIATKLLSEDPDQLVTYYHEKSTRTGEQDKLSDVISVSATGAVSGWVNHANYTGFVYTDLFKRINDAGGYTLDWDAYPDCASDYEILDMLGNSWDWTCSVIVAVNGAEAGQSVNAVRGGSWYATKASRALLAAPTGADVFAFGSSTVDASTLTITASDGRSQRILPRELGFLRLFAENPGKVFTRDDLLDRFWDVSYYGTTRTLDQRLALLRKKLGADASCIAAVHGIGYRYVPVS